MLCDLLRDFILAKGAPENISEANLHQLQKHMGWAEGYTLQNFQHLA